MSDQLSAAAAALGIPESLVRRSAEARAKEAGVSVDEILAAWAGGAAPPRGEQPDASPEISDASHDETAPAPEPLDEAPPPEQPAAPSTAPDSLPGDSRPAPRAPEPPPPPKEVTPREAIRYPVVVTVPTAGLKERMSASVPWWLAALFVIIPVFGLLQLAGASTNECGQGTELLPDRVTGELGNCDGSEFEGRGPPGGGADFIALGEEIYLGSAGCSGCHGVQGGGGVGPALNTVLATFSSCLDHVDWVSKGTQGYQAEGRTGYGDSNKSFGPVQMPGFASSLSAEQIAAVSAFERVRFGGEPREEALVDCGLVEAEGEEGEGASEDEGLDGTTVVPDEGEVPAEGQSDQTTP